MANGLDETRALAHAGRVRALNGRDDLDGITVLAGIECDILRRRPARSRRRLPRRSSTSSSLRYTRRFDQSEEQMTDRLLSRHRVPLGRRHRATRRGGRSCAASRSRANMDRVFDAAVAHGVALEINGQPDRLDLDDVLARRARDRGVRLIIDSDAHSPAALGNLRWGVAVARRAWLEPQDVLNTQPIDAFRASLRRHAADSADGAKNHPQRSTRRASSGGDPRRDPRALFQDHRRRPSTGTSIAPSIC